MALSRKEEYERLIPFANKQLAEKINAEEYERLIVFTNNKQLAEKLEVEELHFVGNFGLCSDDNEEFKRFVLKLLEKDDWHTWEFSDFLEGSLCDDKEVMIKFAVISRYGLSKASDRLKDDKDVVLASVKEHGFTLMYASDRLKDDEEVVFAAINKLKSSLQFASERLRNKLGQT